MRKNKYKIIVGVIISLILAVSFFWGDNVPQNTKQESVLNAIHTEQPKATMAADDKQVKLEQPSEEKNCFSEQPTESAIKKNESENDTEKASIVTNVPTEAPSDNTNLLTCTLSVSCKSVLNNMEKLKDAKKEIIPQDGVFLKEKTVEFFEDESVFDVMRREMKNSKISFEFVNTPMYNSVYIEGIGNLYERDCGNYSGWMYSVNGIKPTYSSSQYKVKSGDRIEFFYSCNFMDET